MKGYQDVYENKCYRGAPCLQATPVNVSRDQMWDYYDRATKSFIYLDCRLKQKHYSPSLLQIEEADKFQSGLGTETYETPDLQLADTNGVWFTRSEDAELFRWSPESDNPKICNICDLVCDIRDDKRYLNDDGSCPYPDSAPEPTYSKVQDHDQPCSDYLHPLLLQDLKAINRRRRRTTKAKLWGYLKQKRWRDILISKGERITDVWHRNYQPVTFYFNSFESIWLYVKNLPPAMKKNKTLLQRIRENLEFSPSYLDNLEKGEWEKRMLNHIDEIVQ